MSLLKRAPWGAAALIALAWPTLAKTPPAKPAPKGAAAADTRPFTFVAYGDTRSQPAPHRAVVAEIVRLHPEFVLQSGDLVSNGRDAAQWAEFDQIEKPLRDAHIGYYPSRGNHDLGAFYPKEVREPFDSGDRQNKLYYAFSRHRNRFIVVDSMQDYDPSSAQGRWLEGELAKAQKTAINTFVMFHEAPFSVGPHGPTPEARTYLHPLFVKYRVRAVFCGHDHLYYRTVRDGVPYIVTGGGGAPLYDPDNKQIAIPGDVYIKDYHAVRLVVDGTRVTGTAFRTDGSVMDRFTIGPK